MSCQMPVAAMVQKIKEQYDAGECKNVRDNSPVESNGQREMSVSSGNQPKCRGRCPLDYGQMF